MNSIIPLWSNLPPVGGTGSSPAGTQINGADGGRAFTDYLKDAVENIEHLENVKREDSYLLAIGELDDIAAMQINSEKATIAVQLMVQMRNRLLDSYSEIMRLNI
ncbi:MAG: flagellar hook-basal body complex protein FliE [Oscillospiraceae bacterium]|nr:flagellar hook-basal body complex protein FliE [Oscillospiraceae bacterium]